MEGGIRFARCVGLFHAGCACVGEPFLPVRSKGMEKPYYGLSYSSLQEGRDVDGPQPHTDRRSSNHSVCACDVLGFWGSHRFGISASSGCRRHLDSCHFASAPPTPWESACLAQGAPTLILLPL